MAAIQAAAEGERLAPRPRHVNLALASDDEEPIGLLAAVNSTIVHSAEPHLVHFHLIVPNDARKRIRSQLESLFPLCTFRAYSLDGGGVRAKILRHMRRRDADPVFVSPFRFAAGYLPLLLPAVKRVLYLETDVIVRGDVAELFHMQLHGAPAGAVENCARPLASLLNSSHFSVQESQSFGASKCTFSAAALLIDVAQWMLLDVSSRLEYWMQMNLRTSNLYRADRSVPPLLLALLPLYRKLPQEWHAGGLGQRRLPKEETLHWRNFWESRGVAWPDEKKPQRRGSQPHRLVHTGGAPRASVPPAKLLHWDGPQKPWERFGAGKGRPPPMRCREEAYAARDVPCAQLWEPYALEARSRLGWATLDMAAAASRAAEAAAREAGTEERELPRLATLEQEQEEAGRPRGVHVSVLSVDGNPYGLIGLVNSTIRNAAPAERSHLRFHVVVPAAIQVTVSRKLGRLFPSELSISIVAAPEDKIARLSLRLQSLGLATSALHFPLLWLHHTLGAELRRTLLLPSSTLVLGDLRELYSVALNGKVGAVVEECTRTFENLYNHHHKLFSGHGRSSCVFEPQLQLIDLHAWRRDDVPKSLLEFAGYQRRTENLYLNHALASLSMSIHVSSLIVLDKRVLRLPGRWLASGLGRDGWSYGEAAYWHRFWGQQGTHWQFSSRPVRAPHALAQPRREAGQAQLLLFDGPIKPWLRRCSKDSKEEVSQCGEPKAPGEKGIEEADCALLWQPFVARQHTSLIEATEEELVAGRPPASKQTPCMPERAAQPPAHALDANAVLEVQANAMRGRARLGLGGDGAALPGAAGAPLGGVRRRMPNMSAMLGGDTVAGKGPKKKGAKKKGGA